MNKMIERVIAEHELARPVMGTIFLVCMTLCYTWLQFVPTKSHVMYSKLEKCFPLQVSSCLALAPQSSSSLSCHFFFFSGSHPNSILVKEK